MVYSNNVIKTRVSFGLLEIFVVALQMHVHN